MYLSLCYHFSLAEGMVKSDRDHRATKSPSRCREKLHHHLALYYTKHTRITWHLYMCIPCAACPPHHSSAGERSWNVKRKTVTDIQICNHGSVPCIHTHMATHGQGSTVFDLKPKSAATECWSGHHCTPIMPAVFKQGGKFLVGNFCAN